MRVLLLIPLLLVAACVDKVRNVYDRTTNLCWDATDGLDNPTPLVQKCYDEVTDAEFNARQFVAQKYRNIPRVKETTNAAAQ